DDPSNWNYTLIQNDGGVARSVYYPRFNNLGAPIRANYGTDKLNSIAIGLITQALTNKQKFFLWLAPFAPHEPEAPAPRYRYVYRGARPPPDPSFLQKMSNAPAWVNALPTPNSLLCQIRWLNIVRSMRALDDGIDAIMTTLSNFSALNNTMIFYCTDQ